jgi:hypothetical protein
MNKNQKLFSFHLTWMHPMEIIAIQMNHRPCLLPLVILILNIGPSALAQTVVEMDMPNAAALLESNNLGGAIPFFTELSNNYRKHANVRVHSHRFEASLSVLADALRTDFDGSGDQYIPDLTLWSIFGNTGSHVFLAASLLDHCNVLLASNVESLKGMLAFELLSGTSRGLISMEEAKRKAKLLAIDVNVGEDTDGRAVLSFFNHQEPLKPIVGKIAVIEPPDLIWD